MSLRARTVLWTAVVFALAWSFARADQLYSVTGDDRRADIAYAGTERLSIVRQGHMRRYVAVVTYTRSDEAGKAIVHARFVQELESNGDLVDRTDADPDFLTVLNQPFAVQLDPTTMGDLRRLRGEVPFKAVSPLGGAQLVGFLRSAGSGIVGGMAAVGVRFEADGPMSGSLPEHPGATLAGRMHVDGTAYYRSRDALLLALDATLTIDGSLRGDHDASIPVRITYHRKIAPLGR
jgi:hypothetical protein